MPQGAKYYVYPAAVLEVIKKIYIKLHITITEKNFVRVGDIVLLGDDINKKRNDWKLGVVQECIKGKDNEVRGAKVRVEGKKKPLVLSRPVQKLFPIEVRNENEQAKGQSNEFGGPALDASLVAPSRPARRAAALDSQWKTQGMLDS